MPIDERIFQSVCNQAREAALLRTAADTLEWALGNLASAQFFDAARRQLGDLSKMFGRGEFQPLREWLRRHVHRHGRCYSGNELVHRATGRPLSAQSLIGYLNDKLRPLYEIAG